MLKKICRSGKSNIRLYAPQLILWIPITKNQTNVGKMKEQYMPKTPTYQMGN
jgi:hypothetical protein